jgi:hypothetical protein
LMVPTYIADVPAASHCEDETKDALDPDIAVIVRSGAFHGDEGAEWPELGRPGHRGSTHELSVPSAEKGAKPDFGEPDVPVLIHEAEGLRIVLGSHDYDDREKPDIQIERRPNGWAIFLHPLGGCDASGYVYFLDDGRSFLVKEKGLGPTEGIKVLEDHETVPEVDRVK